MTYSQDCVIVSPRSHTVSTDLYTDGVSDDGPYQDTSSGKNLVLAVTGTNNPIDAATTKTTPGTVNSWMKAQVAGTTYYIPMYTSKTS